MLVPLDMTDADWLTPAATACTNAEQVAIIPGALQRAWREGQRRYCAYRSDARNQQEHAVLGPQVRRSDSQRSIPKSRRP